MLRNDLLDAVASHDGEDVGGMIEGVEMATLAEVVPRDGRQEECD
jgi:hypothetical protein